MTHGYRLNVEGNIARACRSGPELSGEKPCVSQWTRDNCIPTVSIYVGDILRRYGGVAFRTSDRPSGAETWRDVETNVNCNEKDRACPCHGINSHIIIQSHGLKNFF